MATANDLRRGMAINYNADVCVVLDSQHRAPGDLRAAAPAPARRRRPRTPADVRFSPTQRIERVPMISRKMEFSCRAGEDSVLTRPEAYETATLNAELLGDAEDYVVEASLVGV